jgi:hypothetical protein
MANPKPPRHLPTLVVAFAIAFACTAATPQSKPLPGNTVLFMVDVLKNGKKIKRESITVEGARETYLNIKKTVQEHGIVGVKGWKKQAYNMTAVTRCGFLLETFVATQGIKEGMLDSTPAIEQTTYDIIVALSEVNEESHVACERAPQ